MNCKFGCDNWVVNGYDGLHLCSDCTKAIILSAIAEGWCVVNKQSMKPCWKAHHKCRDAGQHCDLDFHCYEHGEAAHCAHCCNGTLLVPAGASADGTQVPNIP